MIPKAIRKKGEYKSVEGIFVGYFDNSKAYKVWLPQTQTVLKVRDVIFDESNHIERVTIHGTDEDDDLPDLWNNVIPITITPSATSQPGDIQNERDEMSPLTDLTDNSSEQEIEEGLLDEMKEDTERETEVNDDSMDTEAGRDEVRGTDDKEETPYTPQDFEKGPWLDPTNTSYGRGKHHQVIYAEAAKFAHGYTDLEHTEQALVTLAEDEPANYREAMDSPQAEQWKDSMQREYETLMGYYTWTLVDRPPNTNIVGSRWTLRVKRDNLGQTNDLKS